MAILKLFPGVKVGDFVRIRQHNVNPINRDTWRRVVEINDGVLITVNRHGSRRAFRCNTWTKYIVWQPGDPREDGDNI